MVLERIISFACLPVIGLCVWSGCRCESKPAQVSGGRPPVVVVDPDELGRPDPVQEREPNDDRSTAQELPAEQPVEGSLRGSGRDVDWYRVKIPEEGRVLRISLTGVSDLDLTLEAFSEAGKRLVKVNNTRGGGGEVLVNLTVEPATYYFRVKEAKGKGSAKGRYHVHYELREREDGEEAEPNWKSELATPLALDAEAVGYLGWHTDNDWYRVELGHLSAGTRIRLEFDGVDNVRAGIEVRDEKSALIQQRWGRLGQGIVLPNLAIKDSRSIYVVVRCRYDFNVESRYSLRVLSSVPSRATEAEPNDKPATADLLTAGTVVAAVMPDSQDHDLYRIKVSRPTVVSVEAVPPMGLDVALALVDDQGAVIWEVNEDGARHTERLPAVWIHPPAGLFRVRAPDRAKVDDVSPYHIKVVERGGTAWEREPNNKPPEATSWIQAENRIRGFLHPKEDVDIFKVTTGASGHLNLTFSGVDKVKPKLELLDLAGASVLTSASAVTVGAPVTLDAQTGAGTYLLRVSATAGNPHAAYELRREISP